MEELINQFIAFNDEKKEYFILAVAPEICRVFRKNPEAVPRFCRYFKEVSARQMKNGEGDNGRAVQSLV